MHRFFIFLNFFSSFVLKAQLEIITEDSSWLKNNYFNIKATYKNKKGMVQTFGYGYDDLKWKKIKWETFSCHFNGKNTVFFDRAKALEHGAKLMVVGHYKGKTDTIYLKLPRPVRLSFGDAFQRILVNEYTAPEGTLSFDDGSVQSIENSQSIQMMLDIPKTEGINVVFGTIKIGADAYCYPQTMKVCLKGLPEICGVLRFAPAYNYALNIDGVGVSGSASGLGEYGTDGCMSCQDRGIDGLQGGTGETGGTGGDGKNMEIWLKMRPDSIVLVKIKGGTYQDALYYLDFFKGGVIKVNNGGGKGGVGGKGGRGGAGLDEVNGAGPGNGGTGGTGGQGGIGGTGGNCIVYTDSVCLKFIDQIKLNNFGGDGGDAGEAGKGGRGGRKENAGIVGTIVTGRGGPEGTTGRKGYSGLSGDGMVVKIIKY